MGPLEAAAPAVVWRDLDTPLQGSAVWLGADLQRQPQRWVYNLSAAELAELDAVIRHLGAGYKPWSEVQATDYPMQALQAALVQWRQALDHGLGFVLVRGFPAARYRPEACAAAYWWLGRHLGEAVSQNADGDLLGHVRDTGADPSDHYTRLYTTREALAFHTDGADIIGLMCLRTALRGGVSHICSAAQVFNELQRLAPDLLPLCLQPMHHHAHGQFGSTTFEAPIVTLAPTGFRMFLLPWYIRRAAEEFPDQARLSAAQTDLLALLETLPQHPGMALDMSFRAGDMQFLNNALILHARSAYEDAPDPRQRRHLLRLWLNRVATGRPD